MQKYLACRRSPKRFASTPITQAVPTSPKVQAQHCELAIIANQLILKVFLPYLKNCSGPSSDGLLRCVVSSVVDVAQSFRLCASFTQLGGKHSLLLSYSTPLVAPCSTRR